MANVGSAAAGKTLIGAGNGASPTYADIGTNSGLTAHGVVVAEGNGAFQATAAGTAGQVLQSGGGASNPTYSTATYPSTAGTSGTILQSNGTNIVNTTATYPSTAGTSGNVITSNGTNFVSQALPTPPGTTLTNHSVALGTGTANLSSVGPSATSGAILQSAGSSADPAFSTAAYPSTAGTSGTILQSNGTNIVNSSSTFPSTNAQGDLLYGSAANGWSALAKNTSATRYLSNTGTSNNPAWSQVNLANGVTGVLPEANGGTNQSTYTTGDLLYASASNTLSKLGVGSTNQVLTVNGGIPSWQNAPSTNPPFIGQTQNIGIGYSAGTFSVQSANGTALSGSNLGYITLPTGTAGQMNTLSVSANQTFVDAAGSSTLNNNSFGTSAATWAADMPFFLYAASDSTDANPIFLISRIPHIDVTPVAGNIGKTGSAVASTQGSMFALGNPTVANYASRPCVCIGSFRMRKTSTTDWTVQTLGNTDGIGSFQESQIWTFPSGQIGNASGKYYLDNGGTAPAWSANFVTYKISKEGMVWANWLLFNSPGVGTAGSGAVALTAAIPFELNPGAGQIGHNAFGGFQNSAGNPFFLCGPIIAASQVTFRLLNGTTSVLTNANFNGTIGYGHNWSLNYPARIAA